MSALILDLRSPDGTTWINVGRISPTDPPGSLSHNHDGRRELYVFGCMGTHSVVVQCGAGSDYETFDARGNGRMLNDLIAHGPAAVLDEPDKTLVLTVKTDRGKEMTFRFRHDPQDTKH